MSRSAVFISVIGLLAGLLGAAVSYPSAALAQTAAKSPSCSKAGDTFVCVGDLDGTGTEQIMIGYVTFNLGYMVVFENTGQVRRKMCWATQSASCTTPAVGVQ